MKNAWRRLLAWLRWRWHWRQAIEGRFGEVVNRLVNCDGRVAKLDHFVRGERAEFETFVARLASFQENFEHARLALEEQGGKFDALGGRLKDLQDILDRIHWAPGAGTENPGSAECDCGHKSIHRIMLPGDRTVCPDCYQEERQRVDPLFRTRG